MSSGMRDEVYEQAEKELKFIPVEEGKGLEYRLVKIAKALAKLAENKNKIYGDSYKKHGEVIGIFANVTRKYDRLEQIMLSMIEGKNVDSGDESKATTVGDLANYCLLWLLWIEDNRPEEFSKLVEELAEWKVSI